MEFKEASRKDIKIKIGIESLAGGGKTRGSLAIAHGIQAGDMSKVGVAQTEAGRAQCYVEQFPGFKILEIPPPFTPSKFIEVIEAAEKAGFRVLIFDSLSDEWAGQGGALDMHSQATETTKNSFTAWRRITPQHDALYNKILSSPMHIIATFKKKSDYVMEEKNGKVQPKKVGTAAVAREGTEYRFMLQLDIDLHTHLATATKDNLGLFDGKEPFLISTETGRLIREWCLK
jgi:hypothetical protein